MNTKLSSIILLLALAFGGLTPIRSAQAQSVPQQSTMPDGLREAFIKASSEPFSAQDGTHTAQNNGLAYALNETGVQAQASGLQWNVSLRGIGHGNQVTDAQAPEIAQTDSQLEYRRGMVTEWYRNTALGVEQGFTIHESPKSRGPLTLHLDLFTNLEGKLDDDQRGASFTNADGQTLRYNHLKAYDADGAELDAKMILKPAQILLQVDDANAAYPITIDPLITLEQKVLAFDGVAGDYFGASVALSGNTALVGAIGDDNEAGSAYIFTRIGGVWIQQAKLTASDRVLGDEFGLSVALSGDVALVGAPADQQTSGDMNQGSAYIFVKPASGWADMTETAKLRSSDGAMNDRFGRSVALDGNIALIGAPQHKVTYLNQGAAYIFIKPAGGWVSTSAFAAQLTASDGASGDLFGRSVALSGDTALIGAPEDDVTYANQGSAYVFVRSAWGWISTSLYANKLIGAYQMQDDYFGASVAISGDTALVGAPNANVIVFLTNLVDIGLAYAYTRPAAGWSGSVASPAVLISNDLAAGDQFGTSVAVYGNLALVGASLKADGSAAYLFARPVGGSWNDVNGESQKIQASDLIITDDHFGSSVAISGDMALVGNDADYAIFDQQGSTYFYPIAQSLDLGVKAFASVSAPTVGSPITLVANVTNLGNLPVANASLSVPVPAGFSYVSHVATHGAYNHSNGSWSAGDLDAGVSATLTIRATVNASGRTIFAATSLLSDPNAANNSASVKVTPMVIFQSVAAHDGWIRESSETSETGGTVHSADAVFRLGDDQLDRQNRAILSFNTSNLPDTAVISKITLRIKKQGLTGGDPFASLGGLRVDIQAPFFGSSANLAASDFRSDISMGFIGAIPNAPVNGWYARTWLSGSFFSIVNRTGLTQFRFAFAKGDNDNATADYLRFYTGEADSAFRPQLIVEYYVP